MIIGLIIKSHLEVASTLVQKIGTWCSKHNCNVLIDDESVKEFSNPNNFQIVPINEVVEKSDLVITLGGDGTLLRVVRYINSEKNKFIAVNFGRLGFLTEISEDELLDCLESVQNGTAKCDARNMLQVTIYRHDEEIFSSPFLNDVFIQKGAGEQLIDLVVRLKDEPFLSTRGDGVIFATPTGSTAYSLSAGGSIVHPELKAVLITPICPHSLTSRPVVLPADSPLSVIVPNKKDLVIVVDGRSPVLLAYGDVIKINSYPIPLHLIQSANEGYFSILRHKLNWGAPNLVNES